MELEMEETTRIADVSTAVPVGADTVFTRTIDNSPYVQLQQSRTSVEMIVAKMLSIKKLGKSKAELGELVTQIFLHFVTLRQTNRSILLEEDRVKAETECSKAPLDLTTLQLRNLMYEKNHYVKAIQGCRDFKSKYPDIELVSEEEYFRDASEDIKCTIMSIDSAHNLMLQQLNYELFQRKELCKLREKLEQHKKRLLETIANRKKFLSSLPSHLKSLKKASLPVQHQLNVLHTKRLKQHNSAELLPPPLYVIYSQLLAQKEAFAENIDLEIIGSVKDAQTFARFQATKDTALPTNAEGSRFEDDGPDEDDDGQRRRKRPKNTPGKGNPDQTGTYQSHPLKIILHVYDDGVSERKSVKLITLKFEYLLKLNVVCVSIDGSTDMPENNILCNLFPDDTGLEFPHQSAKLFLGDDLVFHENRVSRPYKWVQHLAGIDFLPEVSPLITCADTPTSEASKTDAVISGLSLYRHQKRAQTVVQRIRSRKKSQLALEEQLESLRKLKWPSPTHENVPWSSHTPSCDFHGWLRIGIPLKQDESLAEANQDPHQIDAEITLSSASKEEMESTREDGELPPLVINDAPKETNLLEHSKQQLILISKSTVLSFRKGDEDSDMLLDGDSDMDDSKVQTENTEMDDGMEIHEKLWANYGIREFSLVLTRRVDDKIASLDAKVKISMEYPLRPPLFAVSLNFSSSLSDANDDDFKWYNELRAMEAEVNIHILKMVGCDEEDNILGHQIRYLAMLFDFYMDELYCEIEGRKSSGCSVIDVGLSKPVNGALLGRSFRGRDHRMMLSWKGTHCTPGFPY